jgi:hypothetical protein
MMPPRNLIRMVIANTVRSPRHFVLSAFGIVIGISSFVFLISLSSGVATVIGKIFPIEQVEVRAPHASLLGKDISKKLDDKVVEQIKERPEVAEALPRMNLVFPASGYGTFEGQELKFEVGGFADGIDPSFLAGDPRIGKLFKDWETIEKTGRQKCSPPPRFDFVDDAPAKPPGSGAGSGSGSAAGSGTGSGSAAGSGSGLGSAAGSGATAGSAAAAGSGSALDAGATASSAGAATGPDAGPATVAAAGSAIVDAGIDAGSDTASPASTPAEVVGTGAGAGSAVAVGPGAAGAKPGSGSAKAGSGSAKAGSGSGSGSAKPGAGSGAAVAVAAPPKRRKTKPHSLADNSCADPSLYYCDEADHTCHHRVPVILSPTMIEFYNTQFAPSHSLPQIGELEQFVAERGGFGQMSFEVGLGDTMVAGSNDIIDPSRRRRIQAVVAGISPKALPIGMTMPIQYIRAWNQEFVGDDAAKQYSKIIVTLKDKDRLTIFEQWIIDNGLRLEDSLAGSFATVIFVVTMLFFLVSFLIVTISAINIAHNFFMQVSERRREIGVLRAVGATRTDVRLIVLGEAALIGIIAGAIGVGVAVLAATGVDYLFVHYAPRFPFKPDTLFSFKWWIIVGAMAFSTTFCVLGGFLPARKASLLEPAQALAAQ